MTTYSPYLHIFTEKTCPNIIPKEEIAYSFPYTLDAFQQEGIYRIYKAENILITAHTGSGKTVLAIYAIAHFLKKNKKVYYTSPTKSLSNQKYAEFIEKFGKEGSVGIMTGDIKMNPDAQCLIMTTEILRNMLYQTSEESKKAIKDVGAVIFDEVHYINDPDRGKVWEECIVLLPKEITLVMLSATIDKPEIFASWIGDMKQVPIHLIPTSHRVVPLKHYFWKSYMIENHGKEEWKWKLVEIVDEKGKFQQYDIVKYKYKTFEINQIMDTLVDFLVMENYIPALFFKFSRKKCEIIAKTVRKNLLTFEEIALVEQTFDFYMKEHKHTYQILPQYQDVYQQLKKGVVYHHSGLIPILKEIIEILYSKGLIKILFATETFAIGVNMPTKTVLFSDIEKYDNHGLRELRTDEYLQMSGRAGRRGLDLFGSVILLPTFSLPSETTMRKIMTGASPTLQSKFALTYPFVLKMLSHESFQLDTFLSHSFIQKEQNKQKRALDLEINILQQKIESFHFEENEKTTLEKYEKINERFQDTFFVIKKKEKEKMEKEKKTYEAMPLFSLLYEKYKEYIYTQKELNKLQQTIWWMEHSLSHDIQNMMCFLEQEGYISSSHITPKGIVASSINECNELLFTEIIYRGYLDDLEFHEIVAIIAAFIDEKDPYAADLYLSDIQVSSKVIHILQSITQLGKKFIQLQDQFDIHIEMDYTIHLDFIEPAYIWAQGGTIHEVYQHTSIYDGNFIKAILRIHHICENVMEICKNIERFDICSKLEGYGPILIRDITSIHSLYVHS